MARNDGDPPNDESGNSSEVTDRRFDEEQQLWIIRTYSDETKSRITKTVFFNPDNVKTGMREMYSDDRTKYTHYYNDGSIRTETIYSAEGKERYFDDGILESRINYSNNGKKYVMHEYYPGGNDKTDIHYHDDETVSSITNYNPAGKKQSSIRYNEEGKKTSEDGYYPDGTRQIETFYNDDETVNFINYFYPNGKKSKYVSYHNGESLSSETEYNEQEEKIQVINYYDDRSKSVENYEYTSEMTITTTTMFNTDDEQIKMEVETRKNDDNFIGELIAKRVYDKGVLTYNFVTGLDTGSVSTEFYYKPDSNVPSFVKRFDDLNGNVRKLQFDVREENNNFFNNFFINENNIQYAYYHNKQGKLNNIVIRTYKQVEGSEKPVVVKYEDINMSSGKKTTQEYNDDGTNKGRKLKEKLTAEAINDFKQNLYSVYEEVKPELEAFADNLFIITSKKVDVSILSYEAHNKETEIFVAEQKRKETVKVNNTELKRLGNELAEIVAKRTWEDYPNLVNKIKEIKKIAEIGVENNSKPAKKILKKLDWILFAIDEHEQMAGDVTSIPKNKLRADIVSAVEKIPTYIDKVVTKSEDTRTTGEKLMQFMKQPRTFRKRKPVDTFEEVNKEVNEEVVLPVGDAVVAAVVGAVPVEAPVDTVSDPIAEVVEPVDKTPVEPTKPSDKTPIIIAVPETDIELASILSAEDGLEKYDLLQQWVERKYLLATTLNDVERKLNETLRLNDANYADLLLENLNDTKQMLDSEDASIFEDRIKDLIKSVNGKKEKELSSSNATDLFNYEIKLFDDLVGSIRKSKIENAENILLYFKGQIETIYNDINDLGAYTEEKVDGKEKVEKIAEVYIDQTKLDKLSTVVIKTCGLINNMHLNSKSVKGYQKLIDNILQCKISLNDLPPTNTNGIKKETLKMVNLLKTAAGEKKIKPVKPKKEKNKNAEKAEKLEVEVVFNSNEFEVFSKFADLLVAKEKLKKSKYDKEVLAKEQDIKKEFTAVLDGKVSSLDSDHKNAVMSKAFKYVALEMNEKRNQDNRLLYGIGRKLRTVPGIAITIAVGIAGVALAPVSVGASVGLLSVYALARGVSTYMGVNGIMTAVHRGIRQKTGDVTKRLGASIMYGVDNKGVNQNIGKNVSLVTGAINSAVEDVVDKTVDAVGDAVDKTSGVVGDAVDKTVDVVEDTAINVENIVNGITDYATKFRNYKIIRHSVGAVAGIAAIFSANTSANNVFDYAKDVIEKGPIQATKDVIVEGVHNWSLFFKKMFGKAEVPSVANADSLIVNDSIHQGNIIAVSKEGLDVASKGSLDVAPKGSLDVAPKGSLDVVPKGSLDVASNGSLDVASNGSLGVVSDTPGIVPNETITPSSSNDSLLARAKESLMQKFFPDSDASVGNVNDIIISGDPVVAPNSVVVSTPVVTPTPVPVVAPNSVVVSTPVVAPTPVPVVAPVDTPLTNVPTSADSVTQVQTSMLKKVFDKPAPGSTVVTGDLGLSQIVLGDSPLGDSANILDTTGLTGAQLGDTLSDSSLVTGSIDTLHTDTITNIDSGSFVSDVDTIIPADTIAGLDSPTPLDTTIPVKGAVDVFNGDSGVVNVVMPTATAQVLEFTAHEGDGIWDLSDRALKFHFGEAYTNLSAGDQNLLTDRLKDVFVDNPGLIGLDTTEIYTSPNLDGIGLRLHAVAEKLVDKEMIDQALGIFKNKLGNTAKVAGNLSKVTKVKMGA